MIRFVAGLLLALILDAGNLAAQTPVQQPNYGPLNAPNFGQMLIGAGVATLPIGGTDSRPIVQGGVTWRLTGPIQNGELKSPFVTINGTNCTLGVACTPSAPASSLTVGTTTISSGINGNLLSNSGGVLSNSVAIGTSGGVLGLLNANKTDSGADVFTGSLSATGVVTGNIAPHVASEALLAASASTLYPNGVWRDAYSSSSNAGPVFYTLSSSPCSFNAGAGDGGIQVQTADGECWIASQSGAFDVRQWGAVCNGVNSADTGPILAAANAANAGVVQRILFPGGQICRINETIAFLKATTLDSEGGPYDDTTIGQSPGIANNGAVITWYGSARPMFTFKSATLHNVLLGGRIHNVVTDCANVATIGLQLSTVGNWEVDSGGARCASAGMQIDDTNGGISLNNYILRYWYVAESAPGAENGHALSLYGPTYGVTESHVGTLFSNTVNGDGLHLDDVDGTLVDYVFANIQSAGTGNSVNFVDGARSVTVSYVGAGPITFGAGTYGNTVFADVENPTNPFVDNSGGKNNGCWTAQASPQARNCFGPSFTYSPTITCGSGTIGTYSTQVGRYVASTFGGISVQFDVQAAIGTCSGTVAISLPVAATLASRQSLSVFDNTAASPLLSGIIQSTGSVVFLVNASGNPTVTHEFVGSGTYQ